MFHNRFFVRFLSPIGAALSCFVAGCQRLPPPPAVPPFADIYTQWQASQVAAMPDSLGKTVSCSFRDAPLLDVLRFISNTSGVSVICSESLDESTVSLECVNQSVADVLGYLAKRFDTQITSDGRFFYLGKISDTDKGVFVSAVRRLRDDDWLKLISPLLSRDGKASVVDGVLVVSDFGSVLSRVFRTVSDIQTADIGSYVVQLWVLSLEKNEASELGMALVPSGDISAALASAGHASAYSFALAGRLNYLLTRKHDDLSCNALFVLSDGAQGSIVRGVKVPIPKKTVSTYGTVQISGWDFVQTGLQLKASCRSLSADRCRVGLDISNSTIQQYIGDAPQTLEQTLSCSPIVRSGAVYLAGQMDTVSRSASVYAFGRSASGVAGVVQVWLRVYRIADTSGSVSPVGGTKGGTPLGGRIKAALVTPSAPALGLTVSGGISPLSKAKEPLPVVIAPVFSPVVVSAPPSGAVPALPAP